MKWLKRILLTFAFLLVAAVTVLVLLLREQRPVYSGKLQLQRLSEEVETYFDAYGIPHIYGQNEEDVFRAFGYIHAQEKLFQMETLRRVSAGRLSEIFGSKLLDIDRFFRMLGIQIQAEKSAAYLTEQRNEPWAKAALAYLDGINQYIENGKTPVEYYLLKIPKEKFTVKDMYLVADYLSFNFQMGFRTDPLMSRIRKKLGDRYLNDLALGYVPGSVQNRSYSSDSSMSSKISCTFDNIENNLPLKIWTGSNAWVIAPWKSTSGKVLFENDTHIGFQQPAVWYEAHLECPGFRFYGSFFSGFPNAPIGHTLRYAWGVTILENDDLDFFVERPNPQHPDQVWNKDHWEDLAVREEIIHVRDSADVKVKLRVSRHGPVCSDVMSDFKEITSDPVSACWTLLNQPCNLVEITYRLSHAGSMNDFRNAVADVTAPGLNILYGDADNNIAWWTAAKFVKRPEHTNNALLLDGASGDDDWLGYYDFSYNPKAENPPSGYVYSTNNQPSAMRGVFHPGYYLPEDRALRVTQLLSQDKKFTVEDLQRFNTDVTNPVAAKVCHALLARLRPDAKNKSSLTGNVYEILSAWDGRHALNDVAPTVYYHWLYLVLHGALADEMGEKDFDAFLKTHVEKNSVLPFVVNDSSAWWDDTTTVNKKETNTDVISTGFEKTIDDLQTELGDNPEQWLWLRVHTVEVEHAIGKQKPFDHFFNVGPSPEMGGIETVNNASFNQTADIRCKANLGPALRRTIDFADPENGKSIIPTGQSGNFMSPHYKDQFALYLSGQVRKEMMNREEILKSCKDKLVFLPGK